MEARAAAATPSNALTSGVSPACVAVIGVLLVAIALNPGASLEVT